jgi:hypothetical protein
VTHVLYRFGPWSWRVKQNVKGRNLTIAKERTAREALERLLPGFFMGSIFFLWIASV